MSTRFPCDGGAVIHMVKADLPQITRFEREVNQKLFRAGIGARLVLLGSGELPCELKIPEAERRIVRSKRARTRTRAGTVRRVR